MTDTEKKTLQTELETTLHDNILDFWLTNMNDKSGGFYGRIDGHGVVHEDAERGAVLNARLLWAFAAAYRKTGRPEYLEAARHARDYLIDNFFDPAYGGMFWSLHADGTPSDDKVQFYSLGFAIYGFSEMVRATGDTLSYSMARRLFFDIERNGHDTKRGGYIEATKRDWSPITDMRLSDKDLNSPKSANTHLHILEPYTNLLRVWPNQMVKDRVRELIEIFLDKILEPSTGHLGLFFTEDWQRVDDEISYGHEIEAAWLLLEAAEQLGDPGLLERVKKAAAQITKASEEGLNADGSLAYAVKGGVLDNERHWWVQAENVTGQLWAARKLGFEGSERKALATWDYIKKNLIDPEGEWYWSRLADGSVNRDEDKAGFWKCPYHNTRMCLEALDYINS